MEERIWTGLLLDFYGGLLTEHQRSTLELYLMEDLSLGEIGEQLGKMCIRDRIGGTPCELEPPRWYIPCGIPSSR